MSLFDELEKDEAEQTESKPSALEAELAKDEAAGESGSSLEAELAKDEAELTQATPEVDPAKLDEAEDVVLAKAKTGAPVAEADLETVSNRIEEKQQAVDMVKSIAQPHGKRWLKMAKGAMDVIGRVGKFASQPIEGPVKYTPANLMLEVGKKLPVSETVLEKAGMPSTVNLPMDVKYGPMIAQALRGVEGLTGIPMDKIPDRFVLGMFMDSMLAAGGSRLLAKWSASNLLKADPERITQVVREWSNSTPELVNAMEREIIRQENAAARGLGKARAATPDEYGKIREALAEQIVSDSSLAPNEAIIGAGRFEKGEDGVWRLVKTASELEKLGAAKGVIEETKAIVGASAEASKLAMEAKVALPEPGAADLSALQEAKVGIMHAFSSPRYVVPELYSLHGEKVSLMAAMKAKFWTRLDAYKDLQKNPERLELIAKVLDGVDNHPEIAKDWLNLTKPEAEALVAFRESFDELGDMLYSITKEEQFKKGNRILTYLTHVVKNHMTPNKVTVPERLNQMVEVGEKFGKKRTGAQGYSLNPFEAFEEYANWATEKMADAAIRPHWERIMATYNDSRKGYANWFWNNTHRIANGPQSVSKAMSHIRNGIYTSSLGWNLGSALINRTQAFVFGSARIGHGAYARGVRLAHEASKATPGGKKLAALVHDSGILEDMSEMIVNKHYNKSASIGDKLSSSAMKWFSQSESRNKKEIYLGGYFDMLDKINTVKKAPGTFAATEKLLAQHGIDVTKNAEEQAHRYAFKAVMDTQFDLSKAGQSYLASNPVMGTLMMFTSFPIKSAEYAAHLTKNVVPKILRHPLQSYADPQVREAVRLAMNVGVTAAVLGAAGVSWRSIVGPENFIPNLSPALKMVLRSLSTGHAIAENAMGIMTGQKSINGLFDPNFEKDSYLTQKGKELFLRDASMLFGVPGTAQAWKIMKVARIMADNIDNTSGLWKVYDPKSGALKYEASPMSVLKMMILPSQDEEHYFQQIKNDFNETEKRKNAGRQVQKLLLDGDMAGAQALAKEFGIKPRVSKQSRRRRSMTDEERRARRKHGRRSK